MHKIYLACPYSDVSLTTMHNRYEIANIKAGELMRDGYIVFSPISHSHPISGHLPASCNNYDFWMKQDLSLLTEWADSLFVITIPGWHNSKGVQREIEVAQLHNIPIDYVRV